MSMASVDDRKVAKAIGRVIRVSPQKLNLVAAMIRGKSVDKALRELTFCRKRISNDVKKLLESAIANAENNQGLDIDQLVVKEAYVGKSLSMKRFRPRAKGRASKILKPFSRLSIILREEESA
jgi:large subunit ribosomal protein L22